jgi:nicotinamidase-related amidase
MKNLTILTLTVATLFWSCGRNANTGSADRQKEVVKNEVKNQVDDKEPAISQLNEKYLIVLDMQEFPVTDDFKEPVTLSQINPINHIIENSDPGKVIYVKAAAIALSVSLKGISVDTVSIPVLDKRLKVVNNTVFIKTKGNAFTSEGLTGFLKKHEVQKIVVVGMMAEECLYKTILGGKKLGYEMYTIPEAVIGKTPESKEKVIKELAGKGIKILTME